MSTFLLLAVLSGTCALVYEVVWTREVALVVGGQVEAISIVLVVYFGGLGLGTRWLGPIADRAARPLLLYAYLEGAAGLLALASGPLLRVFAREGLESAPPGALLAITCGLLLPTTFLLGGTLPALLRASSPDQDSLGRSSGLLVGANTAGAVAGVVLAALLIPRVGLQSSLLGAGVVALIVALSAALLSRPSRSLQTPPETSRRSMPNPPAESKAPARSNAPTEILLAALLLGIATLGYEVLAARGAMLRLGSSLTAWALVLGLFLAGLAIGNLVFAGPSRRAQSPATWLAAIELLAALCLGLGVLSLLPALTGSAGGVSAMSVATVVVAVLPAAVLMGGAFPFLVRLAQPGPQNLASAFAQVSAFNTAGGVIGSVLAPFVLLPQLGFTNAVAACALLNGLVALRFFYVGAQGTARMARVAASICALAAAGLVLNAARPPQRGLHVLSVEYGRQATTVVVHNGTHRTLIVDGDPEAATGGDARVTEELMGAFSVLLHPNPQRLLEVGFGSGITLGTISRFPVERIQCVEIAESVVRAGRFFVPDNVGASDGRDPRIQIEIADGRAYLARHPATFDVVVANTLHPWSVGSTGLYSREYFERIRRALRPGGIAVQWLALAPVGAETVGAILRTMYEVFPNGSIWWAAENLIVVGYTNPSVDDRTLLAERARSPEGIAGLSQVLSVSSVSDLLSRRVSSLSEAAPLFDAASILTDDRPTLELLASDRREARPGSAMELVSQLAGAGAKADPNVEALGTWLNSRVERTAGRVEEADRMEARASAMGLELAGRAAMARREAVARGRLESGELQEAAAGFDEVLRVDPDSAGANFGKGLIAYQSGDTRRARSIFERLVAAHPSHAAGWNLLGVVRREAGEKERARAAFGSALRADPFHIQALVNSGMLLLELDDLLGAEKMLERLRDVSPLGSSREEVALSSAIAEFSH